MNKFIDAHIQGIVVRRCGMRVIPGAGQGPRKKTKKPKRETRKHDLLAKQMSIHND